MKNMNKLMNIKLINFAYTKLRKWYNIFKEKVDKFMGDFAFTNSYFGSADEVDLAHWFVLKENMSHKKIRNYAIMLKLGL